MGKRQERERQLLINSMNMLLSIYEKEDEYPNLVKYFRKTAALRCLLALIDEFSSKYEPAITASSRRRWYFVSQRYLVEHYGGSRSTWHKSLTVLHDIGLLFRMRPNENSTDPKVLHAYRIAQQRGYSRAETFYSIPQYTPKMFKEADKRIAKYQENGVSTSNLNKTSVIIASGQKQANRVYANGFTITELQQYIMDEITHQIESALTFKGYATKQEIIFNSINSVYADHNNGLIRWESEKKVNKLWDSVHNKLLSDTNAVYRRPTKAEKALYNLPDDKWIITRRNDHE